MLRIEYFDVLAQIGPVLLLAYVLEERLGSAKGRGVMAMRIAGLVFTLVGETWALTVVAGGVSPDAKNGLLAAAAMMLGVAYLAGSLAGGFKPDVADEESRQASIAAYSVGFVFTLAAGALVAISFM